MKREIKAEIKKEIKKEYIIETILSGLLTVMFMSAFFFGLFYPEYGYMAVDYSKERKVEQGEVVYSSYFYDYFLKIRQHGKEYIIDDK